jgi:signal transduction histidine kinase
MHHDISAIQTFRDTQLTRSYYAVSIFGFLALLASLSRAFLVGWHDVMFLHILIYILILTITLMRKRLPYLLKAWTITGIAFVIGVAGILVWGLTAFGVPALFAFCMLATMLFGVRVGIVAAALSILMIVIVGVGVHFHFITFSFDIETYVQSFSSWTVVMFSMALSAGLIVVSLGTQNQQVEGLVHTLSTRNAELLEANKRLKAEIIERERAEEERQQFELRLRRSSKMEALGTLAGGVAHDLNNILAGAVSYPDLLLVQLPMDSPLRKPIEMIRRTGIKASVIVQDLLTLARRGLAIKDVVNINDVIQEYLRSPEYERLKSFNPGLEVRTELDESLNQNLGSPVQLIKVVMNLVSNGAEAMPQGGTLSISTENCSVSEPIKGYELIPKGQYVVLQVEDTGTGISPEDKEKIFEPFFTKKVMGRSGTGLGMSVVWGTVRDHDGYIDLKTEEAVGTVFRLYFPRTTRTAPEIKTASATIDYRGRGESILIVDDVKEQREIASSMLKELGYSVEAVSSGEEAVDYIKERKIDLLILDMIMEPGIDGLETYKRILRIHPAQKAILTSGYSETELVNQAQELGAGIFVKKPYLLESVGRAVRAELGE